MAYESQWERLSTAADRIAKANGISVDEAKADLCLAISDDSVRIRAKLLKHNTRPMRSSETVLSGKHFHAPRFDPREIDWAKSVPLKPWFVDHCKIPGHWEFELVEVCAPDVTSILCDAPKISVAQPKPGPISNRKVRTNPKLEAARRAISVLYPQDMPDQSELTNKQLCQRVAEHLKARGLEVSDATILRAAGRRK